MKIAFEQILNGRRPDLILGGINHGDNSSVNTHYSGTMGIAREGCLKYVPSVAFSSCDYNPDANLEHLRSYVVKIVKQVLSDGLPKGVCLNVNFPIRDSFKGIKVCRMGYGSWIKETLRCEHPRGFDYYWMLGKYRNDEPSATDTDGMIKEFLAKLSSDSDNVDYRKPIPNDVEITNYSLDGVLLTLHFDEDYSKMSAVDEVLCRAAVVRTMTQIDGVDCVAFYIGDAPLTDAKGNLVGTMNQDSFIENPGEQINSIQNTTLTLYFSNLDGDGLVKEVREDVYYSSNISMEKLIMEQLLDGPKTKDAKSAIPEGTKLVSVSVVDGVCYVSLDEAFKNQDYKVNEGIVIYSIVDSLSELSTISKVQISVNGDTSGVYRDNFPLADMYDRNMDYVTGAESAFSETEEPTETD